MAKLKKALDTLFNLEYSSVYNILHKNKHENGLTIYGIYQSAHPTWQGWDVVKEVLKDNPDIRTASKILSGNVILKTWVENFYKENFWNIAKLSDVKSQHIAEEIFVFGVNVGMKIAVIKAQKLIGAVPDGICGNMTVKALNNFDEVAFDISFDKVEQAYYDAIIKNKPYLSINKKGWYNRSVAV